MTRTILSTALAACILASTSVTAIAGYVKIEGVDEPAVKEADSGQTNARQQNRRVEFGPVKN